MSFPVYLLSWLVFLAAALFLFAHFLGRRVERAVPARGEWIEVNGERIHYRSLGTADQAIVLVHGLGGQMRNFDYLPLQEMAAKYRLVLIDRPGSGHSRRTDDRGAGIAAQARTVTAFIAALKLPQPPLLVGHSLGGAISLAAGLQSPQAIAGLALIAPLTHLVPGGPPPAFRSLAIRTPWLRRLFAHTLAIPGAIAGSRKVLEFVFAPEPAPRDFPMRGGGLLGLRPNAFYGTSTDLVAIEEDLPAQELRYGELKLPLHVLYGDGDRVLDWKAQGQALADKVPQARLEVVPGAGHMLPVTRPERTAEFLGRAAASVFVQQSMPA
jgi:pimeloyl-ACP methyl ester carboxylesterase